jgi:hypothetical protein
VDHAETFAQLIVETIIHGSRMVYRMDQCRTIHDFDLYYPDGRVGAAEVTASVDEAGERTNAAILDPKKGGSTIKAKLCKKDWRIWPESEANINNIRKRGDEYLAKVESTGIEKFFSASDKWKYPSVERLYTELLIFSGEVIQSQDDDRRHIWIAPPVNGGFFSQHLVYEAFHHEAFKEDNRKKLGAACTEERHLLVYVHPQNSQIWCALVGLEPGPVLSDLPPEITDGWVFSEARADHE